MCGRGPIGAKITAARDLARTGDIDALAAGRPQALRHAYVFQSRADETVIEKSGRTSAVFLTDFIGIDIKPDPGNVTDASDYAGHGIVSPDGSDECRADPKKDKTYIRHCGAEDNAGKILHALYAPDTPFDSSKRMSHIPAADVWEFTQQQFIDEVKARATWVSWDLPFYHFRTARCENFDLADTGYLYVPPLMESFP